MRADRSRLDSDFQTDSGPHLKRSLVRDAVWVMNEQISLCISQTRVCHPAAAVISPTITAGLKSLSQHIKSMPEAVPAVLQTLFYVF
ncbi:hypothetical protein DPX16_5383 [Anabarilius grahami]|uniref:Uncharacterized protein n=1 Tax=Anabarilius grahami TaxID=495550 RepID=A0A3N0Y591_ANAGA|nr:hypothetical protein DPX16_5383 [Anabarilius grahami]